MTTADEIPKSWRPLLMAVLRYAATLFLGALAAKLGLPPETVTVEKTVVVEKLVPAPPPVAEDTGARWQPGKRLFAAVVRKRAVAALTKDGFNLVGGDPTPLSRERAEALVDSLDDDTVVAGAHASGQIGDGKFLDRLGDALKWILDHKEQIAEIVRWLLMLLMFAGE